MLKMDKLWGIRLKFPHIGNSDLPLFKKELKDGGFKQVRSCLIFGRNGAGKSTLARALRDGAYDVQYLDNLGADVPSCGEGSNIYVFDEKYIYENLRQADTDQLDPIVLLGEPAQDQEIEQELEKKLSTKNEELDHSTQKEESQQSLISSIYSTIGNTLRGDKAVSSASWKRRSQKYNHDNQHRNVSQRVIDRVIQLASSPLEAGQNIQTFEIEFDNIVQKLDRSLGAKPLEWNVPPSLITIDFPTLNSKINAVSHSYERVNASSSTVGRRIADLNASSRELREKRDLLESLQGTYCTTCLQDLETAHTETVISEISDYLDGLETDSSLKALRNCIISPIPDVDLPSPLASTQPALQLLDVHEKLNEEITALNNTILAKVENPGLAVSITSDNINKFRMEFDSAARAFAAEVKDFNAACQQSTKLRQVAEDINDRIASQEIYATASSLTSAKAEADRLREQIKDIRQDITIIQTRLEAIKEKRRSTKFAANAINFFLTAVFGVDGLRVNAVESGYQVTNRSSDVIPGLLSTGERNILALCYFLVQISSGREFKTAFKVDQLIVLDDPISSFDFDNKYGVMTLMTWLVSQCASGNSQTRICILTHDISVAYDLSKAIKPALQEHIDWELANGSLYATNYNRVDLYKETLAEMVNTSFIYTAISDEPSQSQRPTPDANRIRRVWEAFITFELGAQSVADVAMSPKIQLYFEKMGDAEQSFLLSYAGKLFIHSDSHSQNQINFSNFYLRPTLGEEDYRRFCTEIVCFIHLFSPHHIPSRLAAKRDDAESLLNNLNLLVSRVVHKFPE